MNIFYIGTIRLRRWITTSLQIYSLGIYKMPCSDINIISLFNNETPGDQKFSPIDNLDPQFTWYLDLENQELQVKVDEAYIIGKGNLIIEHIVAFTNDKDMYCNIDPDDADSRKILYEGRLKGKPRFTQSQENNLVGILSTSFSSFALNNVDRSLNRFATKDSFKDCEIRIWECDTYPEVRKKFYFGYTSSATFGKDLSVTVNDIFKKLNNILYSNQTYVQSVARNNGSNQVVNSDMPVTRLCGRNTSFKTEEIFFGGDKFGVRLIPESMPEAFCVNSAVISKTTNRRWVCGFIEDVTSAAESFTVVSLFDVVVGFYIRTFITLSSGSENFTTGDTVIFQSGGGSIIQGLSGNPNEIIVQSPIPYPVIGQTVSIHKISALVLVADGKEFPLIYGIHYTVNTIGVDGLTSITLANSFEDAVALGRALNPVTDKIHYKARNTANKYSMRHGQQIKKLLLSEYNASDINTDSFDDADTDLVLNLNYQIPKMGENFSSKREVLQALLASSLGYIYLDEDLKISYGTYSSNKLNDDTQTISDIENENDTMEHQLEFEDVYSGVVFASEDFGISTTVKDERAVFLYKTNEVFTIDTLTEVFSIALLDLIYGHFKRVSSFYTNPRIKTNFTALDFRSHIGQKKKIESRKGLDYVNATVIGTTDSALRQDLNLINMTETEGRQFASVNGSEENDI